MTAKITIKNNGQVITKNNVKRFNKHDNGDMELILSDGKTILVQNDLYNVSIVLRP